MPDANHLLGYLLGYYPDSVDTIYDTTLKAAFNRNVPNTFEHFSICRSYALDEDLTQDRTHNFNVLKICKKSS